jgi:hypothetical protein
LSAQAGAGATIGNPDTAAFADGASIVIFGASACFEHPEKAKAAAKHSEHGREEGIFIEEIGA